LEILFARLTRMKTLLDSLEIASAAGTDQRELFVKLRAEISAARERLKVVPPTGFD
jgi:hypothetical protein